MTTRTALCNNPENSATPRITGCALLAFCFVLVFCQPRDSSVRAADRPAPRRVTTDGHFKQRPVWSPDGRKLLFTRHRGARIELVVKRSDNASEMILTTGKLPEYDACWSPDGERIAFTRVAQSGTQGNLDVYLANGDGTEPVKFAGDHGKLSHEEYPAWSPDGKRLAWSSTAEGNQEIYTGDVATGEAVRITSDPALDAHPAWSPDSRRIAFATNRWGDFDIALVDADGGKLTRLTDSPGLDDYPVFSPDGARVAFMSNRDGNFDIYVLDLRDRRVFNATQHPGIDHFPAWTPDGRLAFVSNRDDGFDIYTMDVE